MIDLTRRARQVIHADVGVEDMCREFDEILRHHVPYAVAAWSTHDPATGLSTACMLTGIDEDPERESAIFRHEFDPDEPSTYFDLIRDGRTIAILAEETDGDLSRAARWRNVFSNFGVTDELRAILWAQGQAWGSVSLYRLGERFSSDEGATVEALAPVVAEGIRLGLLRAAATRPEAVDDPPGIIEVAHDGSVVALTQPGEHWLDVGGHHLVSAARAAASAVQVRQDWAGATSRLVAEDGRVLVLHASSTTGDGNGVAVIVEAARPAQVGALLVDAYGLTARQRDVLGLLLLGRSMTQVARALEISEHTANDHRKAIYQRVGVSSRSELAALLQAEHYHPQARGGAVPSPYGFFLRD